MGGLIQWQRLYLDRCKANSALSTALSRLALTPQGTEMPMYRRSPPGALESLPRVSTVEHDLEAKNDLQISNQPICHAGRASKLTPQGTQKVS